MTVESHLTGGSTHVSNPTEIGSDVRAATLEARSRAGVNLVALTVETWQALQFGGVFVLHL